MVFPQVFRAFTRQVTPPEGATPSLPLPRGGARTENPHKNDLQKQVPIWGLFWRPGRPKRNIVANWAHKITPKWRPKWTQKLYKKGACSKTRQSQFGPLFTTLEPCRPPPKRLAPFGMTFGSFFVSFLEAPQKTPKNRHKRSRLETLAPK